MLSIDDLEFMGRNYAKGIPFYMGFLEKWGFEDLFNVLDAGCGFGQWTRALQELNSRVDAIDNSADRVRITKAITSRQFGNTLVSRKNLDKIDYIKDFNGILCFCAIYYNKNWKRIVKRLSEALQPGGKLYINIVTHEYKDPEPNQILIKPEDFREVLEKSGLAITWAGRDEVVNKVGCIGFLCTKTKRDTGNK